MYLLFSSSGSSKLVWTAPLASEHACCGSRRDLGNTLLKAAAYATACWERVEKRRVRTHSRSPSRANFYQLFLGRASLPKQIQEKGTLVLASLLEGLAFESRQVRE